MKLLRDLFMGVGNTNWDLGRILGAFSVLGVLSAAGWNISLGLPLELDKLGVALAAVVGAAAALVYAKDRAKSEATVARAVAADVTPPPAAKPAKPRTSRRR